MERMTHRNDKWNASDIHAVWSATSATTQCCSSPSNCVAPFYFNGTPFCLIGYELARFGKKWDDLQTTTNGMTSWSYDKRARFATQGATSAVDY